MAENFMKEIRFLNNRTRLAFSKISRHSGISLLASKSKKRSNRSTQAQAVPANLLFPLALCLFISEAGELCLMAGPAGSNRIIGIACAVINDVQLPFTKSCQMASSSSSTQTHPSWLTGLEWYWVITHLLRMSPFKPISTPYIRLLILRDFSKQPVV